jgi:hypothetical protein
MARDEVQAGDIGEPSYVYRPTAFGAPHHFRLSARGIEWDTGRRSGLVDFNRVRRVRMVYRPATLQAYRFVTEIWSSDAPRLKIGSVSAKNMVELVNQGGDYRTFIVELHRRVAATGATVRFDAGINPLLYWPGLAAFTAAAIGFIGLILRALSERAGLAALLIAAFLLLFLWQAGNIFYRNRPHSYRPETLPPLLLPRADD